MSPTCPVCGGAELRPRWTVRGDRTEGGVDARSFRPSSQRYGETSGQVLRCDACGHGFLAAAPDPEQVSSAYAQAADAVSLRERDGQVATADRGLARLERHVPPGRLLDLGCWTGSLLLAARTRGWDGVGIEPSAWAVEQARAEGLAVHLGELEDLDRLELEPGSLRAVSACDVLEHLDVPGSALARVRPLLEPGGALYLTVPDAGSTLARGMGRRWWSVLPMHLHYFTRESMTRLLTRHGFAAVHVGTHAKVFTARYYAERVGGYSATAGRLAQSALSRVGQADRAIAPDFRDRMEVIAVRR